MKFKSMLLALSLVGTTPFLLADEEKQGEDTVVVTETTETVSADEQPSCGCEN